MSDEREKKSWREIDANRDRGFAKPVKVASKQEQRAQKLASKAARQELETLFSSSKVSQEKKSRLAEIQGAKGTPAYYEKLTAYYRDFGLPLEWDIQLIFLDHKDIELVTAVLKQLQQSAPREALPRQDLLKSKLKVMALSTFDGRLLDEIEALQKALLAK